MTYTAEQEAIIASTGNCTINAVAGSGKTSTLLYYAATRPSGANILYLAFNRTVREEAARRFAAAGMPQVRVETAHSLAFGYVVPQNGYRVRAKNYGTHEIVRLLHMPPTDEGHDRFILATHIARYLSLFCNSAAQKVTQINYSATIADEKARRFVLQHQEQIVQGTRLLLGKMDRRQIDCTHDFYLKKFQLLSPVLPFDYILFDEGQDASPAMLDVLLQQSAVCVLVGDTHQQIYGWRHAVNALGSVPFPVYPLTASFRFGSALAQLAGDVLRWKQHLGELSAPSIRGCGSPDKTDSVATLARGNLALLLAAIRYTTDHPRCKGIYFEGNIQSYTYADEGASLYDVWYLCNGEREKVRDMLLQSLADEQELEEYIQKTEDRQLGTLLEIVREYGSEIFGLLRRLKELHVGDDKRREAEMIFSSVHRAKGMEYDTVHLTGDFINEARVLRLINQQEPVASALIAEEINLLYVAITRARRRLFIPENLLSKDFQPSVEIQVVRGRVEMDRKNTEIGYSQPNVNYQQQRQRQKQQSRVWLPETDAELRQLFHRGLPLGELAERFGQNKGAIWARLRQLGCFGE